MSRSRLIIGLFLMLAGLSSCRPRGVLSQSEMADVLFDIHLTEALVENPTIPTHSGWNRGLSATDFRDMAYQSVLKKHHISEETFFSSVDYYSKHLRLYIKVYAEVSSRLDGFIKDVDRGKFALAASNPSKAGTPANPVAYRAYIGSQFYRIDTLPAKPYVLSADSLPSFIKWNEDKWLRKETRIPVSFRIIQIQAVSTVKPLVSDSVIRTDSVAENRILLRKTHSGSVKKEIVALEGRKVRQGVRDAAKSVEELEKAKDRNNLTPRIR